MKKYIQTKNLKNIFDLSDDYFKTRMGNELIQGIHYFIPPTTSKTKKTILWDFEALDNWIRGTIIDDELDNLLRRS